MKPDVSSAANEPTVKDLLAAYQQALDLAERLPRIVLLRRSDDLPRWVRTPRSRLFVRYFLVSHMRRALLAFKRGCQREAALGRSSETTSDIAALDQFEQSLPTYKRATALFGAAVLSLALVLGSLFPAHAQEALGNLASGFVSFNPNAVVQALGGPDKAQVAIALMLLASSLYVLLMVPLTSFRWSRVVLNLWPGPGSQDDEETRRRCCSACVAYHLPRCEGLYAYEEQLAKTLRVRPPASDTDLDLLVEAIGLIIVLPVWVTLGVLSLIHLFHRSSSELAGFAANHTTAGNTSTAIALAFLAATIFMAVPARLVWLYDVHARRRSRPSDDAVDVSTLPSATWRRRLMAHLIDTAIVLLIASVLAVLFLLFDEKALKSLNVRLVLIFILFVGPAVASLLGVALFMMRAGRNNGASLGKQLLGLRVVRTGKGAAGVGYWTSLGREVAMKWFVFWTGSALLIAGVPALVNYLWPLKKHNAHKRALHDIVARTRVVNTKQG